MKELLDKVSIKNSKFTTETFSTSFSLGIKLLSPDLQDAIYAIYGFVRFADEIVDSLTAYDQKTLLKRFTEDTWRSIDEKISLNPILNSFQWVVNKYNIDHELIKKFIHSMEMDLSFQNHSQNSLDEYILGSAEVVGLMCLYVFVEGKEEKFLELKPYAMSLGSAFQKVNFLRDLAFDKEKLGRNYFPEIEKHGLSEAVKCEIIKDIYKDFNYAKAGIDKLSSKSRLGVYLAYRYYLELLRKIRSTSAEDLKHKRVRVPDHEKFFIGIQSLFLNLIKSFFKFKGVGDL